MNFFKKFFKKTEVKESLLTKIYECPHCFKELQANDVHFRTGPEIVIDSLIAKFQQAAGLGDDYEDETKEAVNPNHPSTSETYDTLLHKGTGVYRALKNRATGEVFYEKLCPHCHNVLPDIFGTVPLIKISFCGPTNVGKTEYMYRLFATFGQHISQTYRYSFIPDRSGELLKEHLDDVNKSGKEVAESTARIYQKPYFYTLNCGEKGGYLCAFYDIAGEDSADRATTEELKGRRLTNSDGVLLLLYPDSDKKAVNQSGEEIGGTNKDLNSRVAFTLSQIDDRIEREQPIKLAATISKSDLMHQYFDEADEVHYASLFVDNRNVLDNSDLIKINDLSREYLDNADSQLTATLDNLRHYAPHYFAVSALGSDERDKDDATKFANQAYSTRLTEPFLWLLQENGIVLGGEI